MNQELQDKIDAYLNGKFSNEARQIFEREIEQDEILAHDVAMVQLEQSGMDVLIEADLRKKMSGWKTKTLNSENEVSKKAFKIYKNKNVIWIFGSIFFACLLYLLYSVLKNRANLSVPIQNDSKKINTQPIVTTKPIVILPQTPETGKKHIEIDVEPKGKKPIELNNMSRKIESNSNQLLAIEMYDNDKIDYKQIERSEPQTNNPLQTIIEAWTDKDFNKVVTLCKAVNEGSGVYLKSREILGHAYFNLKNYELAEKAFAELTSKSSGTLAENAEYYRLLSLVALNKIPEAKIILEKIKNDSGHVAYDKVVKLSNRSIELIH